MKVIKWLGIEYAKTFAFCVIVAAVIGAAMTFIAYPWQTLTALFVGLVLWVVGAFIFG